MNQLMMDINFNLITNYKLFFLLLIMEEEKDLIQEVYLKLMKNINLVLLKLVDKKNNKKNNNFYTKNKNNKVYFIF